MTAKPEHVQRLTAMRDDCRRHRLTDDQAALDAALGALAQPEPDYRTLRGWLLGIAVVGQVQGQDVVYRSSVGELLGRWLAAQGAGPLGEDPALVPLRDLAPLWRRDDLPRYAEECRWDGLADGVESCAEELQRQVDALALTLDGFATTRRPGESTTTWVVREAAARIQALRDQQPQAKADPATFTLDGLRYCASCSSELPAP